MSGSGSGHRVYRFGEFTLDEQSAELSGSEGRIPLRPQSFDVLRLLLDNDNRLVSKETLYDRIWGDRAVTDDSLAQCLIDIRRALGDSQREVIRTLPRRGYMFVGDVIVTRPDVAVSQPDRSPASAGWRRPAAVVGAVLVLAAIAWFLGPGRAPLPTGELDNSVAVLPFVDLSVRQDQQYLGDGLSEDIINSLGKYPELRVIARTSSFSLAGRSADVQQIRAALNVAYVLEGSVRRFGDQVYVVANLVDASTSTQVWTSDYQASQQALMTIHRSIARGVAEQIVPGLPALAATSRDTSFNAFDLMWLGSQYEDEVKGQSEVDRVALDRAIYYYREATLADPESALAHGRLAGALLYGGDVSAASDVIARALDLDPDLSEVQVTLGALYLAINEPDKAGEALRRAIDLNPSNVDALGAYASWYWIHTRNDATDYFREAMELDPANLTRYADLGFYLGSNFRTGETQQVLDTVRERFDGPEAWHVLASLSVFTGRIDESIAWTTRARDAEPGNPLHVAALAELLIDIGDYDAALALQPEPGVGALLKMAQYDEVIEEAQLLIIDEPDDVHLRYLLAFAYNAAGQPGEAVRIFGDLDMLEPEPPRQLIDFSARLILAQALDATGHRAEAIENANWWFDNVDLQGDDWWRSVYGACAYAILGEDEQALNWLERLPASVRLPWRYVVSDSTCFARFADNARYRQVLESLDERMAQERARLPKVLQEFGVQP